MSSPLLSRLRRSCRRAQRPTLKNISPRRRFRTGGTPTFSGIRWATSAVSSGGASSIQAVSYVNGRAATSNLSRLWVWTEEKIQISKPNRSQCLLSDLGMTARPLAGKLLQRSGNTSCARTRLSRLLAVRSNRHAYVNKHGLWSASGWGLELYSDRMYSFCSNTLSVKYISFLISFSSCLMVFFFVFSPCRTSVWRSSCATSRPRWAPPLTLSFSRDRRPSGNSSPASVFTSWISSWFSKR